MKEKKLGLFSIFVFMLLMGTFFVVTPDKVSADQDGDYIYTVSAGVAVITGYTGAGGAITIPSTLGGYPVVAIGDNAFRSDNGNAYLVTSVIFPNTVTSIGFQAFTGCSLLTSVFLPSSLTFIGFDAFMYTGLTSVNIPSSVTNIQSSFFECSALMSINVDPANVNYASVDGVLYNKPITSLLTCPAGKTGALNIPDGVTTIQGYSCRSCHITSVSIPNTVTYIGSYAFSFCTYLPVIFIPASVTQIKSDVFQACYSLYAIHVDSNNANYASIDGVLYNKAITSLICYPGQKAESAFIIPASVTIIEKDAFFNADILTSVTIGNSVTTIKGVAFGYCNSLASVTIGSSVTTIEVGAFSYCFSLTSITFLGLVAPSTVDSHWLYGTPGTVRGHAYANSNFPPPGDVWNGLTMGPNIGGSQLLCTIGVKKNGNQINEIDVRGFFDICFTSYSGDIEQVRFLSDENQNGIIDEGFTWTQWYDWDISENGWHADTKIREWAFYSLGIKEVWAEIKDSNEQTYSSHANIESIAGYSIIVAGQADGRQKSAIDHSANNAYRVLRNLGFDDEHIYYLNEVTQQIGGYNVVDNTASLDGFQNSINLIKNKIGDNTIPLIIYIVGHGIPEIFDFYTESDLLSSSQLNDMLNDFNNNLKLIVLGTCYSGSFITKYQVTDSISADNRIIIAAAHDDEERFSVLGLGGWFHSSDRFWGNLNNGLNVKQAFITDLWPGDITHLLLDDNGDFIGHPPLYLENDGLLAEDTIIGIPGSDDLELTSWYSVWIHSAGELRAYDSENRVTGLRDGEIVEEIPNSIFDEQDEIIALFSDSDSYIFEVVGTNIGTYGLDIGYIQSSEAINFQASDIPIKINTVHRYSINWNVLSQGEDGVSLQIDSDGDGIFEKTITCDSDLTQEEYLFKTDDIPPSITIETPSPWEALQDGVTFSSVVTDSFGVDWVKYAIRNPGGPLGTVINPTFESLAASPMSDDKWHLTFDTTQLDDGYYVLYINATDNPGNEGYTTVNFSIRNWAVLENLPNTPNSKAGRTMPVKFSLRVVAAVDPAEPFVRNEELTIKIYEKTNPGTILQTSTYGSASTDYRISSTEEQYITNFHTLSAPKTYVVEIWRIPLLIGSFEFQTVK